MNKISSQHVICMRELGAGTRITFLRSKTRGWTKDHQHAFSGLQSGIEMKMCVKLLWRCEPTFSSFRSDGHTYVDRHRQAKPCCGKLSILAEEMCNRTLDIVGRLSSFKLHNDVVLNLLHLLSNRPICITHQSASWSQEHGGLESWIVSKVLQTLLSI